MGQPELSVKVAFLTNPFDGSPNFTGGDVTAYVGDRLTTRRGRRDEFAEFAAGTATVRLKNSDRRFDPANTSGPHYGDLLPMKHIVIAALWDAGAGVVTHRLFTGYILSYTMKYVRGTIAYADLECVDGFELLSRLQVGTPTDLVTLAATTGDVRTDDVLDEVGWLSGLRDLDSGADYVLQESILDGVPALEYLQLVARSEDGQFFISKAGLATLQGRTYSGGLSSSGTWGDAADGSELPYIDFQTSYSADQIWNRAEIMRQGGVLQSDNDTGSQLAYLTRTYSRTGLLLTDDADALTIASSIVARYKDPRVRARSMKPQPHVRDTWAEVLGREISDRITVRQKTLLGGSVTEMDAYLEGISISLTRTKDDWTWEFDWSLSSP